MKIETPLIALIFTSLMFSGLFTVFIGMANTYSTDYNIDVFRAEQNASSFQDAFDRVNESESRMKDIQEDFDEENVQDFGTGGLFPFLSLALEIGRQLLDSVGLFRDVLLAGAEIAGIPPQIVSVLISVVIIIMVVTLVMLLLGRSYSD